MFSLVLALDRYLDRLEAVTHVLGDVLERLRDPHALVRTRAFSVGLRLRAGSRSRRGCSRRAVLLQRALHAVMVRDDEAIGRDERRRAATERHDRVFYIGAASGSARTAASMSTPTRTSRRCRQRHLLRHPHATWIGERQPEGEDPDLPSRVAASAWWFHRRCLGLRGCRRADRCSARTCRRTQRRAIRSGWRSFMRGHTTPSHPSPTPLMTRTW